MFTVQPSNLSDYGVAWHFNVYGVVWHLNVYDAAWDLNVYSVIWHLNVCCVTCNGLCPNSRSRRKHVSSFGTLMETLSVSLSCKKGHGRLASH